MVVAAAARHSLLLHPTSWRQRVHRSPFSLTPRVEGLATTRIRCLPHTHLQLLCLLDCKVQLESGSLARVDSAGSADAT